MARSNPYMQQKFLHYSRQAATKSSRLRLDFLTAWYPESDPKAFRALAGLPGVYGILLLALVKDALPQSVVDELFTLSELSTICFNSLALSICQSAVPGDNPGLDNYDLLLISDGLVSLQKRREYDFFWPSLTESAQEELAQLYADLSCRLVPEQALTDKWAFARLSGYSRMLYHLALPGVPPFTVETVRSHLPHLAQQAPIPVEPNQAFAQLYPVLTALFAPV